MTVRIKITHDEPPGGQSALVVYQGRTGDGESWFPLTSHVLAAGTSETFHIHPHGRLIVCTADAGLGSRQPLTISEPPCTGSA